MGVGGMGVVVRRSAGHLVGQRPPGSYTVDPAAAVRVSYAGIVDLEVKVRPGTGRVAGAPAVAEQLTAFDPLSARDTGRIGLARWSVLAAEMDVAVVPPVISADREHVAVAGRRCAHTRDEGDGTTDRRVHRGAVRGHDVRRPVTPFTP
jgi:hypothetical protein